MVTSTSNWEGVSNMFSEGSHIDKSSGSKRAQSVVESEMDKTGTKRTDGDDVRPSNIQKHMNVVASCGKTLGIVDGVEVDSIRLTRKEGSDHEPSSIPLNWVSHVDSQVHLNKNSREAADGWN